MMKYFFKHKTQVEQKLNARALLLFLDFDLTLSPLARNPSHAFLPVSTKNVLKEISAHIPVVVITGRKLSDIKKRVGIKNLICIGNHGLVHEKSGIAKSTPLSILSKNGLKEIKKKFLNLARKYPGVLVEEKKFTLALHYRLLPRENKSAFMADVEKNPPHLKKHGLRGSFDKKTFDVRPDTKTDKGTACLWVLKTIQNKSPKRIIPIYIGDGKTDEDAFRALPNGITVRVGKSQRSLANYYVSKRKEVYKFVLWIESLLVVNKKALK